jgi:hypothetical protein
MPTPYHPRDARASPLRRLLAAAFATFLALYEERFARDHGLLRPAVTRSARRFLECGLPEYGFARFRCGACGEEHLLPFSCRQRALCPSCDAKRAAAWALWVRDELALGVPHRHVVFALPRMLRPYFRHDRSLLTDLARWAWESLREAMAVVAPGARPGALFVIHTAGALLDYHPHVHAIVTDGVFTREGRFYLLPPGALRPLAELFRYRVLGELRARGLLSEERFRLLASWHHSGFSVYFRRRIRAHDGDALEQLARYVRRCPIALERITCEDPESGEERVIYRSGRAPHPRHKANFRVFEPVEFVAEVLQHVPDAWRHESIAYGEYANAARAKRRRQDAAAPEPEPCPLRDATLRARWRDLLRHVLLVDPLQCRRCGGRNDLGLRKRSEPAVAPCA